MKSRTTVLAAAAVLAVAGTASAHGVSKWIESLENAVAAARAALTADPVRLKSVAQIEKLIHAKSNGKSLSAELSSVSKAAAIFEAKLSDQATLAGPFLDASLNYEQDVTGTRSGLALASTSESLSASARKKYKATLKRFDAALAAKVKPKTQIAAQLLRASGAVKVGAGFTPYDQGTPFDWVISSLHIATGGVGVDLDGDRTPDNQLGAVAGQIAGAIDIDQALADALASGGNFALIEMWSAKSLAKPDPLVFVGMMPGTDGDADSGNNFTGAGTFAVGGGAVSPRDSFASSRTATALAKGGKFRMVLAEQLVQFGGILLPTHSRLVIEGKATATSNDGLIGIGFPISSVVTIAAIAGSPLGDTEIALLTLAADLDLDPDIPGNDAISVSLTYTAAKATVTRPGPRMGP